MQIGIFDSGLGGLRIAQSIAAVLPHYDYLYLGDTQRLPYGNRSQETIYNFVIQALEYLFKHDCAIVILACNTASAEALKRVQQEWLPVHYPRRKVLGVIRPTVEYVAQLHQVERVGILATLSTVHSQAYVRELNMICPHCSVIQQAAPLLVPLIENDGIQWVAPILQHYLAGFIKQRVQVVVLGCTHYSLIKEDIARIMDEQVKIVSQDELIPQSLALYLQHHPKIEKKLQRTHLRRYLVTDLTQDYVTFASRLMGFAVPLVKVVLPV